MKGYTYIPEIGEFLRSAREDKDLSQIEVMKLTGINNKTLSGYENNVAEPDLQTLATLANLYHFSIDKLLNINNSSMPENERELIEAFRVISKSRQKSVLVQIKALAAECDK